MSIDLGTPQLSAGLVGRELDLMGIQGRLQDRAVRLATLTGPAGVGKSRLAAEAAHGLAAEFPGGVRSVDLPACASPDAAVEAVAGAVAAGAAAAAAAVARAQSHPGGADPLRFLLILDGVEHLTGVLAPAVAEHLAAQPALTVLATGQQALRIYGERVVPVAPLAPPGPLAEPEVADVQENPAVQLFTRRAHEVNPEFTLTAENVESVVAVCNLLEGVPLVLELAAWRLRLFPLRELHAWLVRGGDSHLSGPVDAPARQRSVLAMAEWSCRGLSERQRTLLGHLAVFEGGATLATAEKVTPLAPGESAEAIEALLDRNLLSLTEHPRADSRLTMSRTIRTYGLALLADSGAERSARQAHARHYQGLLHTLDGRFNGSEQRRWLRAAAVEHENVLAALAHLRDEGDLRGRAALAAASLRPWLVRGELKEGLRWFDTTAQALQEEQKTQNAQDAQDEELLRMRARLHDGAGCLAAALGDHDGASHRHRRAVALYKQLRDPRQGARASARMGLAYFHCGDRAVGQSLLSAARATLEAQGDTAGSAEAATALAEALAAGPAEEVRALLDRAVRIHRQSGEVRDLARTLLAVARAALRENDEEAARSALRESLRLFDSVDERTELPAALEEFALLIQSAAGQPQRATRLLAAAESLRRRTGAKVPDDHWDRVQEAVTGLRRQLGWTVFATAWVEGLRLRPEAMAGEALAAVGTGRHEDRGEAAVLTPRQLQVALLVAEGLTNRQIAGRLEIAEWTVVNHVRHVMRKLGCNSRVQVAWAVGRRN
ncbi:MULTISPECIES: LuxR C-terminal-related transcriptional regulator [unclassified Streptomyces]|uniref:ATP-binding protein n=1 Tax=unclassified Streptomyces TaxID=2593676 RepID=UPI000DC79237|nr:MULTISPECIES: LuxR C-terminal-related transcriptional regulator [unclassified Streptomyces]AWZ06526.1 LuxR family transcriptional regulator [Streptomyces sp. ICC4]AWZ14167.1 LuxR family transcriptional regulator [Streptomyces sp. ICC1]